MPDHDTIWAWHFTDGGKLRDGRPVPPVGQWLRHDGPVKLCESGLHASRRPLDALMDAPGSTVHRVECREIVDENDTKLVCRERRILASADAAETLLAFARWAALTAVDRWDAPPVVRQWVATGDDSLRDPVLSAADYGRFGDFVRAYYAPWSSAAGSARSAARAATHSAADAAAMDAVVTARLLALLGLPEDLTDA